MKWSSQWWIVVSPVLPVTQKLPSERDCRPCHSHSSAKEPLTDHGHVAQALPMIANVFGQGIYGNLLNICPIYAEVPPHLWFAHVMHSHVTSDRCSLHFSHIAATISWLNLTIATQQGMSRYAGSMKSLGGPTKRQRKHLHSPVWHMFLQILQKPGVWSWKDEIRWNPESVWKKVQHVEINHQLLFGAYRKLIVR